MEEQIETTSQQPTIISRAPRERCLIDRRSPSLKGFLLGSLRSRRRQQRRNGEYSLYHNDWYSPSLLFAAILLFGLSCCDALLTVILLNGGATELNPVVDFLLMQEGYYFVAAKFILTGICIVVLIGHHHYRLFRRIRIDFVLWGMVVGYSLLIFYEYSLLQQIHG